MSESGAGWRERAALLLIWVPPALWAVNYIVARKAAGVVEPYTLAFWRWALAGLVLGALAAPELWRQRAVVRAAWWQSLVLGFCGMLVCGAWVYLGAQTTQAMNMALIYSAAPVLIAVGAAFWLGERWRGSQALGVALALVGVFHVVVRGQWGALSQVQWVPGDGWIVLAAIAWALYSLLQKKWASPLSSTARLATICLGGVAVLVPGALWEATRPGALPWSSEATTLVLLAALLPGVGAYWLYTWSQKVLGVSRVAVTLYLGPLYAGVAAWAVLGESLGWHHLVGATLILPGVWMVSRR